MVFVWERIETELPAPAGDQHRYPSAVYRAKVPGGWLVFIEGQQAFFYPDAEHVWDGNTV